MKNLVFNLNIIEIKNLSFTYEGTDRQILKNINLSVEEGDFVAVLGHNGSGKSTLANCINAILEPSDGEVLVAGLSTKDDSDENLLQIRKTVGTVFQNPDNQLIATVVEEDVAFALENIGVEPSEMRRRVDEALNRVEMSSFSKHATHQLSGGQKQRIAIAGILAMRPKVLVLDEPTAMLDPKGRKEVMRVLHELNAEGVTIILITHYMNEAAQAKRIVVINEGEVLVDGTPHYVFQNAGLLKSVGLDVPQSTEFMFLMREAGYRVPLAILTEEECCKVIEDLFCGKIERQF
ncbi:MAG: energy-coupling factor transporter ATPase [Clostridiales bacterium]|nr:MAG: energy-coupling factor transporter ATPase [Clostridiales bacterium]